MEHEITSIVLAEAHEPTPEELGEVREEKQSPPYQVLTLEELMAKEYPPRECILAPWLLTGSLSMIYAARGIGKTHAALGIAYAVATGGEFLGWEAPRPRGVLYLDGEMTGRGLQERLAKIIASDPRPEVGPCPLRFLPADGHPYGMPDLGTLEGQAIINALIPDDTELIIVDNLSTLVRSGKENEGESWQPVQDWAIYHRSKGRSVLFIHHAGKGGQQRGSSRREDALDTVISLKRPPGYQESQGAVFVASFEKSRNIAGSAIRPLEARLESNGDYQRWSVRAVEESTFERVIALAEEGFTQIEIAEELGINKSNVSRHLKKAREQGHLGAGEKGEA